jgi:hypothetical protein
MAPNFKLFSHETKEALHLKLYGDFDGTSAHELLNTLKTNTSRFGQIFIDTEELNTIHPFGRDIFQHNLRTLKNRLNCFIFIGKHKNGLIQ